MPISGLVCYINCSNFQANPLLQYWKKGKSLWIYHLDMPKYFIDESLNLVNLGVGFSGPKPLSPAAAEWVLEQNIYVPLLVQVTEAMRLTKTTAAEIAQATKTREATLHDFLNQKSSMTAAKLDAVLEYLTKKL